MKSYCCDNIFTTLINDVATNIFFICKRRHSNNHNQSCLIDSFLLPNESHSFAYADANSFNSKFVLNSSEENYSVERCRTWQDPNGCGN